MKTRNALFALALLGSGLAASRAADAQPAVDVSVDVFDRTLAPYGDWVVVGRFGRVWRPYRAVVGYEFRPYLTAGHWEYTDYGWSFESDYDWGWAPFHYGRWLLDDYYGWVWVPDNVWGPAWVDWRFGGGYVGWVPLAPSGISISYGFYRPAWCFVPTRQFVVRDVYHYALPVERFHWAYSVTSPVQQPVHYAGAHWNAGPPPGQVSQITGQPIHAASIAPPPPGRVQPVRIAPAAGIATHVVSGSPSAPAPTPAYAPHPAPPAGSVATHVSGGSPSTSGSAPASHPSAPAGVATPAQSAGTPATEPRWGNAPPGGSAHWGPVGDNSPSAPAGHGANSPMPASPHPWMASPGGQTPANVAPHWSGGAPSAPAGQPSYGGHVSAPPPTAPAPTAGGHTIAPAPRVTPAPAVRPSAPAPRPAPAPAAPHRVSAPPEGKQGFYAPHNEAAPRFAAAPRLSGGAHRR